MERSMCGTRPSLWRATPSRRYGGDEGVVGAADGRGKGGGRGEGGGRVGGGRRRLDGALASLMLCW